MTQESRHYVTFSLFQLFLVYMIIKVRKVTIRLSGISLKWYCELKPTKLVIFQLFYGKLSICQLLYVLPSNLSTVICHLLRALNLSPNNLCHLSNASSKLCHLLITEQLSGVIWYVSREIWHVSRDIWQVPGDPWRCILGCHLFR